MRTIVVEAPGGPEVLQLKTDVETPQPGPGQVRIKVAYAGLNFFEVLMRSGRYLRKPSYPCILGGEVSGWVDACGEGVTHLAPDTPVCALTGSGGGYAEFAVADASGVMPLPPGVPLRAAAAYPLQVLTGWGVLFASARCRAGDWVLVHAAAGGVGMALTQMARQTGCRVIATAGSDEKCEFALKHGAEFAINYREKDFGREVKAITNDRGVDIICDSVGKSNVVGNLRCIANFGLIVVFGYASGEPEYDERLLWGKSCGVSMNGLYHLVLHPELIGRAIKETLPLYANGTYKLHIGGVFPLEQAAEAHARLEGRDSIGKLLLAVHPE